MNIAISGAGICGLYLARELAGKGNDVTVFEQRDIIGKECCSGLFSSRLFDFFPAAKQLEENAIHGCLIHFPKKTIRLRFKQPFSVIDHAELDRLAAKEAKTLGAAIKLGEKIDAARIELLKTKYDRVIGCDGAFSPVREFIGGAKPRLSLGIQGFAADSDKGGMVETWPTRSGFIWRIPRDSCQEYGIMDAPDGAKTAFDRFMETNNIKIERIKAAAIPQGFFLPAEKRITLCGDASGLTKPWSGGGVIWGLTLASILLKNFPNFVQYKKEAGRRFLPEIVFSKMAKKMVYLTGFLIPKAIPDNIAIDGDFLLK